MIANPPPEVVETDIDAPDELKPEVVETEKKPPITMEEMDNITLMSKLRPDSCAKWGGSITFLQRYVN